MIGRLFVACGAVVGLQLAAEARQLPPVPQSSPEGERIYRDGMLPDGSALRGRRVWTSDIVGKDAACAMCHARSGMGTVEGRVVIAPITGTFLFHPGERESAPADDEHHHLATPTDRRAYTDEMLARAIREGVNADGRSLDGLMPRFDLDDASMKALIAYLRQLSVARAPGVFNGELHFATVVTPDADPVARDAMLDVLRGFFATKNDYEHGAGAPAGSGGPGVGHYRERYRWKLHVWQLSGAPESWQRQLDENLRATPVFAVISGIGGKTWSPVHAFCERQALPCLFPNVDLPVEAESDFYPVYFSRGVLLEADLIAARLAASGVKPGRVVQVFRDDDIGTSAAAALRRDLQATRIAVVDRVIAAGQGAQAIAQACAQARPGDTLVLWLRGDDLAGLPASAPAAAPVFVSGIMAGLEAAPLPAAWRESARMTYPYALPDERRVILEYPMGWFRMRHIAVVNERVQVDTYTACAMVADNLISAYGTYLRDFLIERIEAVAGTGVANGNFKRLGLAPGQRFAAKGGYLVRFTETTGRAVAADGDWIVP